MDSYTSSDEDASRKESEAYYFVGFSINWPDISDEGLNMLNASPEPMEEDDPEEQAEQEEETSRVRENYRFLSGKIEFKS